MPTIDWSEVWGLTVSPWELVLRGSVIYWFIFLAFRTFMRRDMGSIAVSDVLFLMLVADAAQNAMAGDYRSISDGMILVATLLAWNITVDWLAYASPSLRRLLSPRTILLVRDGNIIRHNLRKQFITEEELQAKLREARARQNSIVARLESAHNRAKVREAYAGQKVEEAFSRFDMLERRVDMAEGRADALQLGAPQKTLEEEIAELRSSEKVEAELAALKAKAAGREG